MDAVMFQRILNIPGMETVSVQSRSKNTLFNFIIFPLSRISNFMSFIIPCPHLNVNYKILYCPSANLHYFPWLSTFRFQTDRIYHLYSISDLQLQKSGTHQNRFLRFWHMPPFPYPFYLTRSLPEKLVISMFKQEFQMSVKPAGVLF